MKFRNTVLFILTCFIALQLQAQTNSKSIDELFGDRGEVYFKFQPNQKSEIAKLSAIISIDDVQGNEVYAYANKKEFAKFLDWDINFEILTAPGLEHPVVMKNFDQIKGVSDWDFYPTYEAYVAMMYQFQTDYPDLCQIVNIGQTVQNRDLLFARISDNVGTNEGEAQFMYTSSMHGDETTGYVLSLRLIDYLLSNYGSDPEVDDLVNSLDIWINPLANPDGTYHGGNSTVFGAQRYNANYVDLNRNYPDPEAGPHPDGNAWQIETIHFMDLAEQQHFVMSANFHGGAEVCNYPWDTWSGLNADDDWWQLVCHEYADTAQSFSPNGYMSGFDDGITNGYAWYTITGGRQDYMNYFQQCREFTLELSDSKLLPANQLPAHWDYNKRSLINYIKQTYYGVSGAVTSQSTGEPLEALVYIENHDMDSTMVFSDEVSGKYFRPLYQGTFDITFSAFGYYPQTIENVSVSNYQQTILDVQLTSGDLIVDFTAGSTSVPVGSTINFTDLTFGNIISWEWNFEGGIPATSNLQNPTGILYSEEGTFDVSLTVFDGTNSQTVTKQDYITVSLQYVMQNTTVTTCQGLFMDTGGANGNYSNNENITMTFLPAEAGAKLSCEFLSFNVEAESNCDYDWLKIYDGSSTASTLLGTWCGTNSPGFIEATNESGALTFVFFSDGSVTESGWSANINCESVLLAPIADFSADSTTIVEGSSVLFTDLSLNDPASWNWTFPGGQPGTSTEQNPVVVYNTPGTYSVALVVVNAAGNDNMYKEDYILVENEVGMSANLFSKLTIYPNPASKEIFLQSDQRIIRVTIVNLMGNQIMDVSKTTGLKNLDVSSLPDGSYILIIETNDQIIYKKLQVCLP